MAHKGCSVDISSVVSSHRTEIQSLIDFYGLDIWRVSKYHYMLVGEWFGKEYKDYLAEKLNAG